MSHYHIILSSYHLILSSLSRHRYRIIGIASSLSRHRYRVIAIASSLSRHRPRHPHHPHRPHHPYQNNSKKVIGESRNIFFFGQNKKTGQPRDNSYSAIQSPDKVLQRYTKVPHHAHHPHHPYQNPFFLKARKRIKQENMFRPAAKKIKKRKSTSALYGAQTKVLQRYIEPPEGIVVYLAWPRRRREKANVLRRHTDR